MNFSAYAESLPGTVLDQLYQSLYVCQAILHSLPPLAKQYVMRMLHADQIPAGKQLQPAPPAGGTLSWVRDILTVFCAATRLA